MTTIPDRATLRDYICREMAPYWAGAPEAVLDLPVPGAPPADVEPLPPRLAMVELPIWAASCGVGGRLLVPARFAGLKPGVEAWAAADWFSAAFWYLNGLPEREFEKRRGPVHSYARRLAGWDDRPWEYAWVNRIALFLRAWAARERRADPEELFSPLPGPAISLTWDVDAVSKTLPGRLKQGAFRLYNGARLLAAGDLPGGLGKLRNALSFLARHGDWWTFDRLPVRGAGSGTAAQFNFYADDRRKSFLRWLYDPGYDAGDEKIRHLVSRLLETGNVVGLHPSRDAWKDPALIARQKDRLARIAGIPVNACRQHWLRFSWEDTWAAQEKAGLSFDTTLMFNDRPGFRNAAALAWRPWNFRAGRAHDLLALPTVMMDSHFHDYRPMSRGRRLSEMGRWLDEVRAVSGRAAVLWHPHTLAADFGWRDSFDGLLDMIRRKGLAGP